MNLRAIRYELYDKPSGRLIRAYVLLRNAKAAASKCKRYAVRIVKVKS